MFIEIMVRRGAAVKIIIKQSGIALYNVLANLFALSCTRVSRRGAGKTQEENTFVRSMK